jgi:phosphoglycolate phosphatase-like HAD superfamily hydrolase
MSSETPGNLLYGIPDRLGIDDEIAASVDIFYRLGLGKSPKPFKIIPGVRGMLERLQPHYLLAVVSARGERITNTFLEQFHLTPFFKYIATAQTCDHTKPYPDPILWVADQSNQSPSSCVMIGDTSVDILAAKAAGAQSIGVLCGFGVERELRDSGADIILRSTPDILDILSLK